VFAGLFPVSADDYPALREALDKLRLNDAALFFEPESSEAMGFGFRCGFLGMLHMEIVQERLEREYDLDLITTAPTVVYEVVKTDDSVVLLDNPAKLPPVQQVREIREPIVVASILTPQDYIGNIITLCEEKRGVQRSIQYLATQVQITYEIPLAEVVLDFFDRLKSVSRGYASMDYHFDRFETGPFARVRAEHRRPRRCAQLDRAPHARRAPRPRPGRAHEGPDPAPAVRRGDPGGDRCADHRPFDGEGIAQERAGQVLRRRRQPQEKAAGEAEGRQEAHEAGGSGGNPAGGLPGCAEGGQIGDALGAAGWHDGRQWLGVSR
jgi:hypothetical protein